VRLPKISCTLDALGSSLSNLEGIEASLAITPTPIRKVIHPIQVHHHQCISSFNLLLGFWLESEHHCIAIVCKEFLTACEKGAFNLSFKCGISGPKVDLFLDGEHIQSRLLKFCSHHSIANPLFWFFRKMTPFHYLKTTLLRRRHSI
jgi:hypothetical protein